MILTPENYYSPEANRHYMSVSQYKDFLSCEAQALARLNGNYYEESADCFLIGNYVHSALEGPEALEKFKQQNPSIFSSKGPTKGELKSDYKNAEKMVAAVRNDEVCMSVLTGEKETIITAELYGVKWKAKIDYRDTEKGRFADVKTVKGLYERYWMPEKERYVSFVEKYGYTIQMAVYAELERLHSKRFERLEPLMVAVSKEDEPDKAVICFDEMMIEQELEKVRTQLPHIVQVKNGAIIAHRCEKCRYCRKTKQVKTIIHYMNLLEVV